MEEDILMVYHDGAWMTILRKRGDDIIILFEYEAPFPHDETWSGFVKNSKADSEMTALC